MDFTKLQAHTLSFSQSFSNLFSFKRGSWVGIAPCSEFTQRGLYLLKTQNSGHILAFYNNEDKSMDLGGCSKYFEQGTIMGLVIFYPKNFAPHLHPEKDEKAPSSINFSYITDLYK